jgi:hypothetical protein
MLTTQNKWVMRYKSKLLGNPKTTRPVSAQHQFKSVQKAWCVSFEEFTGTNGGHEKALSSWDGPNQMITEFVKE